MGGDLPKQFLPLGGKPLLMHTLENFHRWDSTVSLTLVLPQTHSAYWQMLCREIGCTAPHQLVQGGQTRFHSVRNGLHHLVEMDAFGGCGDKAAIAVHDGVRPFTPMDVIERCFRMAEAKGCAIPVLPVTDSLREVDGDVSRPIDRTRFCTVQTPQVFRADLLFQAYRQEYQPSFTDDASVLEALHLPVFTVEGDSRNIKITTPFDMAVATAYQATLA
jgi:2-C-methyl-D-erythritol 4-phosphate cytidylyltransferase